MGTLSVLNVGAGDIKLSFDTSNTAEAIRAKRMITDMLKRGYALLIEVDGAYQRAMAFDAQVGEYIIADFDPTVSVPAMEVVPDEPEASEGKAATETSDQSIDRATPAGTGKKRGRPSKRIPMETARAVGVGRSAGG